MRLPAIALASSILLASSAASADEPAPSPSPSSPSTDTFGATSEVPPQTKRVRSDPTLFGLGLATAITGGVALNVGALVFINGAGKDNEEQTSIGGGVMLIGLAMIAAGIPMAVVGGKRVTVPAPAAQQAARPGMVTVLTF